MSHHHTHNDKNWLFSRTGVATIAVVSALGFLIHEGHGAHLLGYLPFALILLCPLTRWKAHCSPSRGRWMWMRERNKPRGRQAVWLSL
jgi:hypothetical protein